MAIRGIRGAISVAENTEQAILAATKELLAKIVEKNLIAKEDIASIFFTTTDDLNAVFPAKAARDLGYTYTPLMCAKEIAVTNSIPMLVRILIHVNSEKTQDQLKPVYLGEAKKLRQDL